MDFENLDTCEDCGVVLTNEDINTYITCCIKCGNLKDEIIPLINQSNNKMKQFELNGKILGVVEVPKGTIKPTTHSVGNKQFVVVHTRIGDGWKQHNIELIGTGFKILSLASEMTEGKANVIMPYQIFEQGNYETKLYVNYDNGEYEFEQALESFKSWCKSEGLVVENPWQKEVDAIPQQEFKEDYVDYELYLEAQKLVKEYLIIYK